jgi:hypothetical protein
MDYNHLHKLFILALSFSLILPFSNARAQDADNPGGGCIPLDVIFIIDQSDSMGGIACGSGSKISQPNDAEGQREFAAEAMVDLLTDLSLDVCENNTNRVSVISFGDYAERDLELTEIAPESFSDSQVLRQSIKESISAGNLCKTNPVAAFKMAADELEYAEDIGGGKRKRVIIFFTDGEPCFVENGAGCGNIGDHIDTLRQVANTDLPFNQTLLKREQCVDDLQNKYQDKKIPDEELNECLTRYAVDDSEYQESTYIYTVLLGRIANENFKNELAAMSEEHGGRLIQLSRNPQEIPKTFKDVIGELSELTIPDVDCGNFAVNPYQKRAIMVFYKFEDNPIQLSYQDVNGTAHSISAGNQNIQDSFNVVEYIPFGVNERYVFSNPYPGVWNLISENCGGLEAYYQEVEINPKGYNPGSQCTL